MRVCMQVLTYRYILQMHTAAFVKTTVGTTKMCTRAYVHSHIYALQMCPAAFVKATATTTKL